MNNSPNSISPPKWPLRLLRKVIRDDYLEEIEGDMEEVFQEHLENYSLKKSRRLYAWDCLKLLRPGLLKHIHSPELFIHTGMLKHNLLITYRSFLRNKSTFLINLAGLSAGLVCVFLIYLWVSDELSVDTFHEQDAQLYQVMRKWERNTETTLEDWVPGPLAEAVREEIPAVNMATNYKTHPVLSGIVTAGDQFRRAIPMYADSDFLKVFSYPLLIGDKDRVLTDKYAAVISEDLALKLFHSAEAAIGQVISWEKKAGDAYNMAHPLTVTGVYQDLPKNSTENFDILLHIDFYEEFNPGLALWSNDQGTAALVVKKGTDIAALEDKITDLVNTKAEFTREMVLARYSSKYLYNRYENGVQVGGRITYVWLFSAIAMLILLIASINFMNLSTARASVRVKEIGVKKTLGASRKSLMLQFVSESLLVSFLALIVAMGMLAFLLPWFNEVTGKQLDLAFDPILLMGILGITFFTGLFSSTYPALYLSGFRPVEILKGRLNISGGEVWTRKGLVVFQFAISVVLIVSVWVIYQQMSFVQSKNLGFEKDHILRLKQDGALDDKVEPFLAEVRKLPTVIQAASSNHELVGAENWTWGLSWEGKTEEESFPVNPIICNYFFIETFGLNIKEGRSFSPEFGTDSSKVILNEMAVKRMGLENPVGKTITFWGDQVEIIGVAEDFNFQSLYEDVGPCIIKQHGEKDNYGEHIWIRMKAGQEGAAISSIEKLYSEFNPGYPFDYGFVDEDYQALYESETRVATLSQYFAGLAILISCLGLFGLAAFTAERRIKEIGIRKILGSSTWGIVSLLSADFTKMVFVAILIALPVSYLIVHRWLESFAYKIELQWWFFAGAALITLLIAWMTVGFQTFKAARINPIDSLRDD